MHYQRVSGHTCNRILISCYSAITGFRSDIFEKEMSRVIIVSSMLIAAKQIPPHTSTVIAISAFVPPLSLLSGCRSRGKNSN